MDALFFAEGAPLKGEFEELYTSLLLDRSDNVINLCEMKYSRGSFQITKSYSEDLKRKIAAFEQVENPRKAVHLTIVTRKLVLGVVLVVGVVAVTAMVRPCYCKYCGYKANSVSTLMANKCLRHPLGSLKGCHSPSQ